MTAQAETTSLPRPEELEKFLHALRRLVPEALYRLACVLVRVVQTLALELEKSRVSVIRLRQLVFGSSIQKTRRGHAGCRGKSGTSGTSGRIRGNPKGRGHGRNSLERQFPGAERHLVLHPELTSGSSCGSDCSGRMNVLTRMRSVPRVFGQPFLLMKLWQLQGLRCSACQRIVWAPVPEEAEGPKYDATAASMLAVMVYANGMPLSRLARHQEACGVPVPETVQWKLLDDLAQVCEPVYDALLTRAAAGQILHIDDTHRKVLSLGRGKTKEEEDASDEPASKKPRTGCFTTAIVSRTQGQTITLFFTGCQHAGENLRDLLRRRPCELEKPIQMCDALSRNHSPERDTVMCHCLSHGRSKVADLHVLFPESVEHVLDELGKVYEVDARARRECLSDWARLRMHREESLPVLDELCGWLEAQLAEKAVEPNSSLGQAFTYLLKHWYQLTQFTRVPGAPLDNNLCERVLKMAIRHRNNSLFYKTTRGAEVGDRLMSLIHTCRLAGVDPFGYLTALQRHQADLTADPAAWLPWSYKQAQAAASAAAETRPSVGRTPALQTRRPAPEESASGRLASACARPAELDRPAALHSATADASEARYQESSPSKHTTSPRGRPPPQRLGGAAKRPAAPDRPRSVPSPLPADAWATGTSPP